MTTINIPADGEPITINITPTLPSEPSVPESIPVFTSIEDLGEYSGDSPVVILSISWRALAVRLPLVSSDVYVTQAKSRYLLVREDSLQFDANGNNQPVKYGILSLEPTPAQFYDAATGHWKVPANVVDSLSPLPNLWTPINP